MYAHIKMRLLSYIFFCHKSMLVSNYIYAYNYSFGANCHFGAKIYSSSANFKKMELNLAGYKELLKLKLISKNSV